MRADRGIGTGRFIPVMIIIVAVIAVSSFYVWSRRDVFFSGPHEQLKDATLEQLPITLHRPDMPVSIRIYSPDAEGLVAVTMHIRYRSDIQSLAKDAVNALLAPRSADQQTLLTGIRLKSLYIDSSGTAYLDMQPSAPEQALRGSAWEELLALYAIVNTLTDNFEEIKSVKFLLNGKEARTLAGHIDLTGYFERRPDLVKQ